MTTITWKDVKSGKSRIQIIRSKDKLETTLQLLKYDKALDCYINANKHGKKVVSIEKIAGISYESEDEKEIFRRFKLIPKREDYPNGD